MTLTSDPLEQNIQSAILIALRFAFPRGWFARNNTGACKTAHGGFIRYGLGVGGADIVGCLLGYFVAIEVKRPGEHMRLEQREWRDALLAAGGIFVEAHSVNEALDAVRLELAKRKAA